MSSHSAPKLTTSDDLLICTACGTQYDEVGVEAGGKGKDECRICDDPRQFVLPTGQSFTTLRQMRNPSSNQTDTGTSSKGYKNIFRQDPVDGRIWEIWTEPKFGIGQRAILIQTPHGNILWDLIAYLDQDTVDKITSLGPLTLILISHPHFYTTWADWSRTFSCPVYFSKCDAEIWANRLNTPDAQPKLLTETYTEVSQGATAVVCGGHFDGSMVLHWEGNLFVADTVFTVAASQNPDPARPDVNSYSFLYAIPNFVPLDPDSILRIWRAIKPLEFHTTWGNVVDTMVVREREGQRMRVKERVLESAKIAVRRMGWREHALLEERV